MVIEIQLLLQNKFPWKLQLVICKIQEYVSETDAQTEIFFFLHLKTSWTSIHMFFQQIRSFRRSCGSSFMDESGRWRSIVMRREDPRLCFQDVWVDGGKRAGVPPPESSKSSPVTAWLTCFRCSTPSGLLMLKLYSILCFCSAVHLLDSSLHTSGQCKGGTGTQAECRNRLQTKIQECASNKNEKWLILSFL